MQKAEKDRKKKLQFRFVPTRRVMSNSKKIAKNMKKNKKYHYGLISDQNWLEKAKKEGK